ncbi:MAG: protoporphyrinogen oxidase [Hyphomicrobiales bacterium]|nr:protoporphyrinogen oxidase [Hyphomicrobiales bacterium]
MNILIFYGTSEGQTRKIATVLAERLNRLSHKTTVLDAAEVHPSLDPTRFDGAIIAARVHAESYQGSIRRFVRHHRAALEQMPTAFISVSMMATGERPGDWERAVGYAENFFARTGWRPEHTHHAAGAQRESEHNFIGRRLLSLIGGHRQDGGTDHEFTDWPALGRFADTWAIATGRSTSTVRSKVVVIANGRAALRNQQARRAAAHGSFHLQS